MRPPILPEDAAKALTDRLWMHPWSCGVAIEGVGPDAALVVLTTVLLEAQAFLDQCGGRWSGYPLRARRVDP